MKSILLHIHDDAGQTARLQSALDLARLHGGHLTCLQSMPFAAYAGEPFTGAVLLSYDAYVETMQATREKIEGSLANEDVPWDWIDTRGSGSGAILMHSHLSDLIVLSPSSRAIDPDAAAPIVGELAVKARAPLLVVRDSQRGFDGTVPVLVAWNGSSEAAQALRSCRALLSKSRGVHILCVEDTDTGGLAARDAASYLFRHGIEATVHTRSRSGAGVNATILSVAAEVGAGAIVMGAYGRSRLAEFMLGGVTRAMLRDAELPLLLAH